MQVGSVAGDVVDVTVTSGSKTITDPDAFTFRAAVVLTAVTGDTKGSPIGRCCSVLHVTHIIEAGIMLWLKKLA